MLNNSIMQESTTKTVRMPDLEPRTFAQFLKFAYLGYCGISDGVAARSVHQSVLPSHFDCHSCSTKDELRKNHHYPFHNRDCRNKFNTYTATAHARYYAYCVVQGCQNYWTLDNSRVLLCASHRGTELGSSYPAFREIDDPDPQAPTLSRCSKDFLSRQYGCGKLSHEDLSCLLDLHNAVEKSASLDHDKNHNVPLLDHAKLYVFADQYMVEDLRDISIHKLHRNLTEIDIAKKTIQELINLVAFSYEGTSSNGDIQKGSADRLRSLVMAFVVDRKEELMAHADFREMIGSGGPQTADFFGLVFPVRRESSRSSGKDQWGMPGKRLK